jgi:PAS domain S-box-containing protein
VNGRNQDFDKLLADYRELQLRVTRFSAVEQELINTRDQLDAELVLYKRLNDFIKDAFKVVSEKKFLQLVCETIVDLFEVESGLVYLSVLDGNGESYLFTEGFRLTDAEKLKFTIDLEQLSLGQRKERAFILNNDNFKAFSKFSTFSRALFYQFNDELSSIRLSIMGLVSIEFDPIYQQFLPRHETIFSVFAQQVQSLLGNIRKNDKIKDQVVEISQSQTELRKLSQIALKTKNGVIIADSYGRIEWVNEAFEKITGFSLEEVKGKKPKDFLQGKETDNLTLEKLKYALDNKEYVEVIVTNYKKNGEKYYNALQINPIFDENGQHQSFVALQRDITAEIIAKNELLNVNERFEIIAEKSHIGIWERDYANNKSNWNKELLNQYGTNEDSMSAEPLRHLIDFIHPEDKDAVFVKVNNFINSTEEITEDEFRIINGINNETRILKALIIAERDVSKKVTKLIGTNIDITEKKLQEKTLESHLKQQELLAEIALEINNSGNLNDRVNSVLKKLYLHLQASRVYIFENIDSGKACTNTYEICSEGISPLIGEQKYVSYIDDIAYIKNALLVNGSIYTDDISIFPPEISEVFEAQSIKSIIMFPLFVRGEFFGFIGFDECDENRRWTKSELELIRAVSGIISTAYERDLSEKNLISSEKKYRNIIDNMNLGLVEVDNENDIIYGNRKFFELSQLQDPELLIFSKRSASVLIELKKENKISYFNKLDEKTYEIGFPKSETETIDLLVSFADTFDQSGEKIGSVSVFLDITSVKQLQKNLENALNERDIFLSKSTVLKNFYENVLNNLPSEVIVLNPELQVTFSNQHFHRKDEIWESILGKSLYELDSSEYADEYSFDVLITKINEAIQNEKLLQFEENCLTEEIEQYTLKSILPVYNSSNQLENIIIIGIDITEIKNIEKNILQKNDELKKINSELDNFVYSVSHDLRSPLLSVKGILSLIFKTAQLEPKVENYLKMAEKSILRLDETIQEILEYSRNARLGLHYDNVNLPDMVSEIYDDIKFSNTQKISFTTEYDFDGAITTDKSRLNTILKNVIGNAFKYLKKVEESQVIFKARKVDGFLLIEVRDNGEGISEEHLSKIFDMFYRASNTSAGTGLGLYICKEILNKLNGEIKISSVKNEGTTVFIKIPLEEDTNITI